MIQARSVEEAEQHIVSLTERVDQLERIVFHHARCFDTLQTPWWKRWLFVLDGWAGQRNLDDKRGPRWRPWRRWYKS